LSICQLHLNLRKEIPIPIASTFCFSSLSHLKARDLINLSALAESTKDGVISEQSDETTVETPRGGNNWNLRADKLRSTSSTSDVTIPSHDRGGILETIVSDARFTKWASLRILRTTTAHGTFYTEQ
jgi:hypothetical protein